MVHSNLQGGAPNFGRPPKANTHRGFFAHGHKKNPHAGCMRVLVFFPEKGFGLGVKVRTRFFENPYRAEIQTAFCEYWSRLSGLGIRFVLRIHARNPYGRIQGQNDKGRDQAADEYPMDGYGDVVEDYGQYA